jgi:uncharacterized membrane protein
MYSWASAAPAVLSAFLATVVEIVEALTIVLAVTLVRGWRPAALGTAAALLLLTTIVLLLGPLLDRVPLHWLQFFIGVLLLLFGMRWLRKAILRSAGVIPLHDEDAAFTAETAHLRLEIARRHRNLDWIAGITAFKAVVLEGLEVVFIVIAVGTGRGLLLPASAGAAVAAIVVILIAVALHRPLSSVPENTLKTAVGVMLSGFGVFWTGEGLGVQWPGGDFALIAFVLLFLIATRITAASVKFTKLKVRARLQGLWGGLLALFVDDRNLALVILGIVFISTVAAYFGLPELAGGLLLFGCITGLIENVLRSGVAKSTIGRSADSVGVDRSDAR